MLSLLKCQELDSVKLQMTGTAAQQRQKLDELSRTQATQAAQAAQGAVAQVNPPHQAGRPCEALRHRQAQDSAVKKSQPGISGRQFAS